MQPEELMQKAIAIAEIGIQQGQTPFGCAIALVEEIIATTHNTVLATVDITAHAEVNALREACRETGQIHLPGALVATTCELCPMCAAALHWARVDTIYYGATIADADDAGFNELPLPAEDVLAQGGPRLVSGVLNNECRELFSQWKSRADRKSY